MNIWSTCHIPIMKQGTPYGKKGLMGKMKSLDHPGCTHGKLNHVLNLLMCINFIFMAVDSLSVSKAIRSSQY